ncbi:MAG TPA: deoxyribonuclease IV [Eubacteriales bacterium]|nr:deoxyribonuclease IV [Eubacteriales bacterium]
MDKIQPFLGCHLSAAKGYRAMGEAALSIGANTFQFFTRNPRGGAMKALDEADANALSELCRTHAFGTLVAHAPYTLNPSSVVPKTRDFAYRCLGEDLERMEHFPHQVYNLHPGSHVGQGIEAGIRQTAALLNDVLTDAQRTTVLIETMSGHGSEIGGTFEQVAELISRIHPTEKIGVCLDTCHVFAAGYDVKNDLDGVLERFDRIVGLRYLRALHVNDSMFGLGSKKDRHARAGEGFIGLEALRNVVRHEAFAGLPMILETPNEPEGHGGEIRLLLAES